MTPPKKQKPRKKAGLQADQYRVKPFRTTEKAPKSWREVFQKVNAHLMRLAVNCFGVVSDGVEVLRKVIRAIPRVLPKKLSVTTAAAHFEADFREGSRQEQVESTEITPPSADQATAALTEVLLRLQAQGLHVNIVNVNGQMTIVVVRPDLAEAALEVAKQQACTQPQAASGGAVLSATTNMVVGMVVHTEPKEST